MSEIFQYEREALRTLLWLKTSFRVNKFNGSSAKYYNPVFRPLKAWAKPYPETTGYLIPTLINYTTLHPKSFLTKAINHSVDWLKRIQNSDGSFPAGFNTSGNPSVFNTAQILIGLQSCDQDASLPDTKMAAQKAFNYLFSSVDTKGRWKEGNYIEGFNPTYYSRVLWPMIAYDTQYLNNKNRAVLEKYALQYFNRYKDDGSFEDWGFEKGKPAFTHTIAYTLRGFLELANILGNDEILTAVKKSMLQLQSSLKNNLLAGTYDENWKGDYSFTCPTGNFQLAIIAFMLAEGNDAFFEFGETLLKENIKFQNKSLTNSLDGGIPGSVPLSGPYQKYAYPNWAAKFFLDAIYIYNQKNNFA